MLNFTAISTLLLALTAMAAPAPADPSANDAAAKEPQASANAESMKWSKFRAIHPDWNNNKCLDVRSNSLQNGTPVQIYDCNGTGAQRWVFGHTGHVRLAGTNFCLDAGSHPASGTGMKIWQCYDNLPAQQWNYWNYKLSLANNNQCLDLTNGNDHNWNQVQTWECFSGNHNQIWTT